jgi:hypothetical protein
MSLEGLAFDAGQGPLTYLHRPALLGISPHREMTIKNAGTRESKPGV